MSRLIESTLTGRISNILVESENEKKICPRCGKTYTGYPATSRFDNKTEICSDCGTDEAMVQFSGGKLDDPNKFNNFMKESDESDEFPRDVRYAAAVLGNKVSRDMEFKKIKQAFEKSGLFSDINVSRDSEGFVVTADTNYRDFNDEQERTAKNIIKSLGYKYDYSDYDDGMCSIFFNESAEPEGEKEILNEEGEKDFTVEHADSEKISELENGSAFTFEGLDASDESLQGLVDFLKENSKGFKTPVTIYTWSGKEFNDKYGLTGNNAYPEDLTFVSISLDSWSEMGNLPMLKFQVGARWLDDIVDNNARREGYNESAGYDPTPEELEADEKKFKDKKKKGIEDRIGELKQAIQDGVSGDEKAEMEKEIAELEGQLNEAYKADDGQWPPYRFSDEDAKYFENLLGPGFKVDIRNTSSGDAPNGTMDISFDNKWVTGWMSSSKELDAEIDKYFTEKNPELEVHRNNIGMTLWLCEKEADKENTINESDKTLKESTESADDFRRNFSSNLTDYINKSLSFNVDNKQEDLEKLEDIISSFKEDIDMINSDFIEYIKSNLGESAHIKESVEVATNDGSTVSTSGAASVQSNEGQVTVTTEDTVVVINNEPALPVEDVALPAEEPADELVAEVPAEEPIEAPVDEVPLEEPVEELPVEDEIVEESEEVSNDDEYGIDATIEAKSLTVMKNQGSTYMLEIKETNGNTSYWVCDDFNAETNEGDNAEAYTSKEDADKDYFGRVGVASEE